MRILFINNYYAPSSSGWGYRQLCEEVVAGLAARDHDVAVLTSNQNDGPETAHPYPVYRFLTIDPDWQSEVSAARQFFVGRRQRERQAVEHLASLMQSFQPQIIFIWHAHGLSRALLQKAEAQADAVTVYYLANYLPEMPDEYIDYWQAAPKSALAKVLKKALRQIALVQLAREGKPIKLNYENVICVSDYVRRRLVAQQLVPDSAVVIHNGVDVSQFLAESRKYSSSDPFSCLIAGRIMAEKGIHTVVEAFILLKKRSGLFPQLQLTILGDGEKWYLQQLRQRVAESGLADTVHFMSPVSRDVMPDILKEHMVFILASEYAEPIARSIQEAMASGMLVIGTTTGGSGELLEHEKTGLVFEAGHARSLVEQLMRAVHEPDLAAKLAMAGQMRVRESFCIEHTVSNIEHYLQNLVNQRKVS